jgi:serine/threonine protein kinase
VLPSNEASPRAIELIRREVQVARAINHPGVCRVFDLGEHVPAGGEARRFFLTMEYLDGVTLGQQIRSNGALPADRLLAIARQLADGLVAAHEAGVVHRDFKSDNVMLMAGSQGGTPRAVIMDFGLARGGPLGIGMASTGGIMVGSAAYMAPEQVQGGPVRQGADIYAFGVVLYEAATGALPFIGTTAIATATKRLMEKPPAPRSRIPELGGPHPALSGLHARGPLSDDGGRAGRAGGHRPGAEAGGGGRRGGRAGDQRRAGWVVAPARVSDRGRADRQRRPACGDPDGDAAAPGRCR